MTGSTLVQRIGDSGLLSHRGTRALLRWAQFSSAMFGFGLGVALMVRSHLGLGPWDAFHTGIHLQTGLTVGLASVLMGAVVVAATWWLGAPPAVGTLVNMVLVAVSIDFALLLVPPTTSLPGSVAYYTVALAIAGISSGAYISTGLGKGPRDGLTLVLSRRYGVSVRKARTMVEMVVLVAGWALGGAVGVGTIIFALLMGPSMQWGLELFGVIPPAAAAAAEEGGVG